MNWLLNVIWKYLTLPLWLLQPSYPDPDAWIVLAFYQIIWVLVHLLLIMAVLFEITKEK